MQGNVRCDTCKFYYPMKTECRVNAPTVLTSIINPQTGAGMNVSGWPGTRPEHWCGKYEKELVATDA